MSWIKEQRRVWYVVALLLLLVAIAGPWGFDRIHVPSPYPCSAPHIRLDEDFCGLPLSLTWSLLAFFGDLGVMIHTLTNYPLVFGTTFFPLLPVVSTLLLLLPGQPGRRRLFHLVALGLGAVTTLFFAVLGFSQANWALAALWGIWLYTGVTATLLLLEVHAVTVKGGHNTSDYR